LRTSPFDFSKRRFAFMQFLNAGPFQKVASEPVEQLAPLIWKTTFAGDLAKPSWQVIGRDLMQRRLAITWHGHGI
jgi:hypothetical protein